MLIGFHSLKGTELFISREESFEYPQIMTKSRWGLGDSFLWFHSTYVPWFCKGRSWVWESQHSWKICIAIRTGWFCIPQRSLAVRNCLINFCWCWKVRVVLSLCFPCSTTTLTETLREFQRISYMYLYDLYVMYPKWGVPSMRPGCKSKSYDSETSLFSPTASAPHTERSLCCPCQCFLALQHLQQWEVKEHLKELYPFSTRWPMQVLRRSRVLFCLTAFAKYWA